jgi:dihydroorotate dehydrogenase electron transfer subunit
MEKSTLHHQSSIVENRPLCTDHYLIVLRDEPLAQAALPGQFVNLRIKSREELLLRRPFSIARTLREQSSVGVVYRIVGKGTAAMKDLKPGETVDLLGPLGKPFSLPEQPVNCLLVGGGVGIAPLWSLADRLSQNRNRITALLGFRSSQFLFGVDLFETCGCETIVTTDDGSFGLKGFVSDPLEEMLKKEFERVYVCGPSLMLKTVIPMIRKAHIQGEVSVEERMGCGFGVCLSCVVNVRKDGVIERQRVCTEGPVFDLEEIILDDET